MAKLSFIDQLTDEGVAHVLPKLRARIRAEVEKSLGAVEALQQDTKRPAKRVAKAVPKRTAKVAAPKPAKAKRQRTSAADIAKHKQVVLDACVRTARTMSWFKKPDIQAKIEDESIDVGRMLSLNVGSADLVSRGSRRQTEYRVAAKHAKANGAPERTVERDEEPAVEA